MLLKELVKDNLKIKIYHNRSAMGNASAKYTIEVIKKLLATKQEINIVFSAAPSQNELLQGLLESQEIDFSKINAFHMDEYIELSPDAPQMFKNFLDRHIFKLAPFKSINYIYNGSDSKETCRRYAALLAEKPLDISLLGIGENGHIAFNDPHVADFNDPEVIKVVDLDQACREQQVNDGSFETYEEVPEKAITLTIPALMSAEYVICTVPTARKAKAVTTTIRGEIKETCPASIMRLHSKAVLFVDGDSGKDLLD